MTNNTDLLGLYDKNMHRLDGHLNTNLFNTIPFVCPADGFHLPVRYAEVLLDAFTQHIVYVVRLDAVTVINRLGANDGYDRTRYLFHHGTPSRPLTSRGFSRRLDKWPELVVYKTQEINII